MPKPDPSVGITTSGSLPSQTGSGPSSEGDTVTKCCNRQGPHQHAVKPRDIEPLIIVDDLPEEPEEIPVDVQISDDEVLVVEEPKEPYNDAKGPPENAPKVSELIKVTAEELRSAPQTDVYDETNQPTMDLETGVITGAKG